MSWERGKADIEALLRNGELERVQPSITLAARMLAEAESHLSSARLLVETDPIAAFSLAYDAARKASTALLAPKDSARHREVGISRFRMRFARSSAAMAACLPSGRSRVCAGLETTSNIRTSIPRDPRRRMQLRELKTLSRSLKSPRRLMQPGSLTSSNTRPLSFPIEIVRVTVLVTRPSYALALRHDDLMRCEVLRLPQTWLSE